MRLMNIFKKKSNKEVTNDRSKIVRHEQAEELGPDVAYAFHMDDVNKYFNGLFPNRKTEIFHELESDIAHVDVYLMLPNEEDDFYVVYTAGMSALEMDMPVEINDDNKHLKRAELFLTMPGDVDVDEIMGGEYSWVLHLIKSYAKMPHANKTWISHGHTIPNGPDMLSFTDDTKLSASLFVYVDDFKTKAGYDISALKLMPIYASELDYKIENGAEALIDLLEEAGHLDVINKRKKIV